MVCVLVSNPSGGNPQREILLLPDEVDPVVTRVLDAGLEITGLSESSAVTGRRLYTLDLTGRGHSPGLPRRLG